MRKPFKIGQKEYKFKKEALMHYRTILNSYDFGQSLSDADFNDLMDLLDYDYLNYLAELALKESDEDEASEEVTINERVLTNQYEISITDIKVSKVQFNTKCFEVFYNDKSSRYISYTMIVNSTKYTPEKLFYVACRSAIHDDIHSVKQDYFDKNSTKGQVKCQETGILSKWDALAVDHRQPHTFSIIVDRFKEVNKVDLEKIEYTSNDQNHIIFKDNIWIDRFKQYHREKANLRIVRKECNSSRTSMARIKRTSNDLIIRG